MNNWSLGFFIFISVVWACETWLFSQGYDSTIHKASSESEKSIQESKIKILKRQANEEEK